MKILTGHISPETAYVVDDYPYGFRLRCKIRYWLEYQPRKGVRMFSQTSNPKCPTLTWNKPKASTYSRFGGAMYLDEQDHVQWSGMHEYMSASECQSWLETYHDGIPPDCLSISEAWLKAKTTYEQKKSEGNSMAHSAAFAAIILTQDTEHSQTPS